MKRIIAIFLAVVMICPVVAFSVFADENDAVENKCELLKAWGVVDSGIEFEPEELVDPGAAMDMLGEISPNAISFGGDSVSTDDMIMALVDILGYEPIIRSSGGGRAAYMQQAAKLGITSGASSSSALTWGNAVILVYNTLNAKAIRDCFNGDYVVSDKIYLEDVMHIYKGNGLIYASGEIALSKAYSMREGYVRIDDTVFYSEGLYTDELIGCSVTYYYKDYNDGDIPTLLYAQMKKNDKVLIIDAEDIISYASKKYTYELNGKTKTASFNADAYVIYNYRPASEYTDAMMKPTSGTVMLNDSDGDGKYDVVNVVSYRYLAVSNIDKIVKRIYDKNDTSNVIEYDDDTVFKRMDGTLASVDDIAKGNIVSVTECADFRTITISDDSISGTVKAVIERDGTWVQINDNEIKFDSSFQDAMPKAGDNVTVYLNHKSQIVFFETETEKCSFGYITKVWEGEDDDRVYIKCYDVQAEDIVTYKLAQKVKLDGIQYKKNSAILNVLTNSGKTIYQLMAFRINGEKEISYLDTSYNSRNDMTKEPGTEETKDSLHITYSSYAEGALAQLHVKEHNGYYMLAGKAVLQNNKSILLKVPEDEMIVTASKKDFEVVSNLYSELENDKLSDKIELYSISNDSMISDVGIMFEAPGLGVSGGNYVGIVADTSIAINDDNDIVRRITIYHDGKRKFLDSDEDEKFPTEDGTEMCVLQKGDVIRVNSSAIDKGEIESAQVIARVIDGKPVYTGNTERKQSLALTALGDYSAERSSIMAEVVDMDGLLMRIKPIQTGEGQNLDEYIAHTWEKPVYICDTNARDMVSLGAHSDIITRKDAGDFCSKLLICNSWSIPYCTVIYK